MSSKRSGAAIRRTDDGGVCADMTAPWFAQMGWETYVREGLIPRIFDTPPLHQEESSYVSWREYESRISDGFKPFHV